MELREGVYTIVGLYKCGNEYRFENVDYTEGREFILKTKQGVIYDEKGRKLYEYYGMC